MGRKSKANVRRPEILSHFYEVIIEEGFEGASIAKIAKRMKVNPSLLIHYFSTKEAMVSGLIEYIIATYANQLLPDFSREKDPAMRWEDVLEVISRLNWDMFVNHAVYYNCYTLGLRDPEVRRQFVALYETLASRLVLEIEFASQNGIISVRDPQKASDMIISLLEGANFYQYVRPQEWTREQRRELIRAVVSTILKSDCF